jgi:NAD(P)-dependent dehydrogenase (short-subunit alcohol dehydrogenase family)
LTSLFDLSGKTALVTGATGGIGRAITHLFGKAGARLIVSDKDEIHCERALSALRAEHIEADCLACDLSDADQVMHFASSALSFARQIDVLVCNAGIAGPAGPLDAISSSDLDRLFTLNLRSVLQLTSLLVPAMAANGSGSVILMSSIAGLRGNKAIGAYGIAKAGISQLARNLAVEWGPSNVRANSISPGLVRTEFASPILDDAHYLERRLLLTPLRRVGEPAEIAAAALFLASDAGAFVTGHNLVVDGGTTISDGN